ncbi:Serine/threonine-protein kinase PrkC [Candidatus Entotheonellaceae bacterium PAL068K]
MYLVWDERFFAFMVAKMLRPDYVHNPRALREMCREAAVLARLAHPVLVRSFGAVLESAYPHILLEHIEGPTLSRLIRRHGPLSLEQSLPLALHLAAVLHYLAAERTVHLDITPRNIIMGILPRLIDLSIARSAESAARLCVPIGTDAYMAPEQCQPQACVGELGPATDMWGLGATLYYATTGKPPFHHIPLDRDATDDVGRFPQLTACPAPLAKNVPTPLRELIMQMLSRNAADRPAPVDIALALELLVVSPPSRFKVS